MKILQLNVWMGKIEGNLRRFLEQNDFDIICMQEVMNSDDARESLSWLCTDKQQIIEDARMPYYFYSPNWRSKLGDGHFEWGNLIMSKIPIIKTGSKFTSGSFNPDTKLGIDPGNSLNIQLAELENGITIVNHHGYWLPNQFGDAESVKAMKNVAKIIKKIKTPLIFCGDLNLTYEAEAMRELDFLRNLTSEHKVKNTLSGIKYDQPVPCDHILLSNGAKVSNFQVRDEIVSDHRALTVEIEF